MKNTLKSKIKYLFLFILTWGIILFNYTSVCFAAWDISDEKKKTFYKTNVDFFERSSVFSSMLRSLGWAILKLLKTVSDAAETLYKKSWKFLDFTTWGDFGKWIESYRIFVIALMCVSFLALGIILIVKRDKKVKLMQSIVLSVFILTSSTIGLTYMNKIIINLQSGLVSEKSSSTATQTIGENLSSIVKVDKGIGLENLSGNNFADYNYSKMSETTFKFIRPDEVINYNTKKVGDTAKEILKTYYDPDTDDLEEVDNGWGTNSEDDSDLLNEFYYNYKIDYLPVIITLAGLIFVFISISYKVVRIVYEISFGRVAGYFYSAEVSSDEKKKKILIMIRDNYITLFVVMILVKVYLLATNYITSNMTDMNSLTKAFIVLFISFATADGPNLIQRITGVDAGLSSGFRTMMGLYHGARAGIGMTKGALKIPGAIFGSTKNAASKVKGAFSKTDKSVNNALNDGKEQNDKMANDINGENSDKSNLKNDLNKPKFDEGKNQNNNMNKTVKGSDEKTNKNDKANDLNGRNQNSDLNNSLNQIFDKDTNLRNSNNMTSIDNDINRDRVSMLANENAKLKDEITELKNKK